MKRSFLLKSMLLLCALIAGSSSVWATTVTRTENFASSSAASDTYSCSSQATTSGMQDDWDYAWTPSGSVYVFQSGVRLGKSGGTGTVTNTTMLSGISTGTSVTIKVYAAVWNTDGGSLVVTYNGSSTTKAPANSAITNTSADYSSSDFSSSTNFTITKAADVTSFSIASSAKRIFIDKVEVVYDDGPAKLANDLAWSSASKDVTYSETPYGLPTLTNPHSLAIEYGSTDESVATIDSEGNITIKNKTGNTTISAHTDGDATYAAGTVTYTLNVTRKVVLEDGVFNFGFGPSDGGDYGSGMTQGSDIIENESKTWTSGNITLVVANRYAWNTDGKMVIYKKAGGANAAGSITISCPADKVITKIELTGPYTGTGALSNSSANTGNYTVTSSSAIWTGAAQSVSFAASNSTYINTVTVTYGNELTTEVQAYGWASYIAPAAVEFEANTAYVVTDASASAGLTLEAITEAPAGTPLLLKGAGEKTIAVVASATAPTTNLLTVCDGTIASGKYPYVLAKNGTSAAFKQWTGEASVLNGRVVLVLDEAVAAGSPVFSLDGETTGINTVNGSGFMVNGSEVYNLNGQRVAQPTKGLYIVNGRKVVIK